MASSYFHSHALLYVIHSHASSGKVLGACKVGLVELHASQRAGLEVRAGGKGGEALGGKDHNGALVGLTGTWYYQHSAIITQALWLGRS
eukprot:1811209-Rhodomonas_salina.2